MIEVLVVACLTGSQPGTDTCVLLREIVTRQQLEVCAPASPVIEQMMSEHPDRYIAWVTCAVTDAKEA